MTETRHCEYCGAEFTTDNKRRIYCSGTCKRRSNKKRRSTPNVRVSVKQPKITIEDMVAECLRLSKEKGRIIQYGELSQMILTGRHVMGGKKNG